MKNTVILLLLCGSALGLAGCRSHNCAVGYEFSDRESGPDINYYTDDGEWCGWVQQKLDGMWWAEWMTIPQGKYFVRRQDAKRWAESHCPPAKATK